MLAVPELTYAHLLEQPQVFVYTPVPVGARGAGGGGGAAQLRQFPFVHAVHVRFTGPDEPLRHAVQLVKIVRRVADLTVPTPAEPGHVTDKTLGVLEALGERVGVVHPEPGQATVVVRQTEVEKAGDRVPDVRVTVGFGWETRNDQRHSPSLHVPVDDVG